MNMLVVFPTSKTQAPNKNQQGAAKEIKEKVIVGKIDLEFFNFALYYAWNEWLRNRVSLR